MLKNNEKGSTLIVVLLLVIVITILGAALLSMNMSATKQFTNKEEQVQARHLAEMGVSHYQAKISDVVNEHNTEEPVIYYIDKGNGKGKGKGNKANDVKVVDEEKTRREHTRKLCEKINEVSISDFKSILTTGDYEMEIEGLDCENISTADQNIVININGTGKVKATEREIGAEVTVFRLGNNIDKEEGKEDSDLNEFEKPNPPTNDVDERLSFEMKKREELVISKNLYVKGNFSIDPGGGDEPNYLKVEKDLYVEGEMAFNNHACVVVEGDLTVLGNIDIKNKNKSFVIVFGNAYFEGKLNDKGSKASEVIYVKGKVNSKTGTSVRSYSELTKDGKQTCRIEDDGPTNSEINKMKWGVEPNVNADYFPEKNS